MSVTARPSYFGIGGAAVAFTLDLAPKAAVLDVALGRLAEARARLEQEPAWSRVDKPTERL